MTDFALMLVADKGQSAHTIHAVDPNGYDAWLAMLPLALAELDLIDEYEFVVHPRIAGHGPVLLLNWTLARQV